jgi:hypothetical protein
MAQQQLGHDLEQDLDIDAAMLEQAAALVDGAPAFGTTGDVPMGDTTGEDAEDADTDDSAAAGDDSEEYDSAVDDTLEDDEFIEAMIASDEVTGADLADAAADEAALLAAMAAGSAPLNPLPPAPGSPESPFRKCDCLGTMPGRACLRCGGSRWTKACPAAGCKGSGKLTAQSRQASGPPRVERCGFCMGKGLVPARLGEVSEATQIHADALAEERARKFSLGPEIAGKAAECEIRRRKPVLPTLKPKQQHKLKPKFGSKKR